MDYLNNDIFFIEWDALPGASLAAHTEEDAWGAVITLRASLAQPTEINDWQARVKPRFPVSFTYTPHLTPEDGYVIDMHVFRTPALMMGDGEKTVCVLPLTDGVQNGGARYYLDFDAPRRVMTLGVTATRKAEHVLYRRAGNITLPSGEFVFRFRVMVLRGEAVKNPFRAALDFWWTHYGSAQSALLPPCAKLAPYVANTYAWAFGGWKDIVFHECVLGGAIVGAPQMIVFADESPNNPTPVKPRETADIWNQAWFSSLRSAQGLYRYARETGNEEYKRIALEIKELALRMPMENGLFDSVLLLPRAGKPEEKQVRFGNSNRNPLCNGSIENAPRHILDMSWTALQMLTWYDELEKDERLKAYALAYAERLLSLQDESGYYPGWLDPANGQPMAALRQSPESAVSATFLIQCSELTGEKKYLESALRCMDTLTREVLPDSRWEDFETYYSCSPFGKDDHLGKKYARNNCYKQCSLSPFWMAQALLACHRTTGDKKYIPLGERCLDEMLMYQSSFQPDYMPVTVVGGFGVMNADAELNDARQSLFAELILAYGELLGRREYTERGSAALRASFSMMYCPENPVVKTQWEKKFPYFSARDYGFMMENYGHDGRADARGGGIGVEGGAFTIYDWGNGAASEAFMRVKAHYPGLFRE